MVSRLRVKSEHAIGFLKGRFQSLMGLRVRIDDKRSHQYAAYWAVTCVALHNFALMDELERRENSDDSDDSDTDPFIGTGMSSDDEPIQQEEPVAGRRGNPRTAALVQAKARREELKGLFLG